MVRLVTKQINNCEVCKEGKAEWLFYRRSWGSNQVILCCKKCISIVESERFNIGK